MITLCLSTLAVALVSKRCILFIYNWTNYIWTAFKHTNITCLDNMRYLRNSILTYGTVGVVLVPEIFNFFLRNEF